MSDRPRDDVDARLERLARATSGVRARADFTARVMAAATASVPSSAAWFVPVWRAGRRFVPIALLVLTVTSAWALRSQADADEASLDPEGDGVEVSF